MSVCVSTMNARFYCAIGVKLAVVAEGTGRLVLAGLTSPILPFAKSYPSISGFSLADDDHYLIIIPIDFCFFFTILDSLLSHGRFYT